jgi:hypothetical protein
MGVTRTLASLSVVFKLNSAAFKKGVANSRKEINKFKGDLGKIGAMAGGIFAASTIIRFTASAAKLAGELEGVKMAFDRVRPSAAFMGELQEATANTVSEFDLMKRAVMASNFKIPMTELASLMEFATKRAQETGESVDYLVNSIVIGIGRKSPLILDNLGISAVQLRKKLDNVGHSGASVFQVAAAVAEIAEEEMSKMGGIIDTTAIKHQQLAAEIQNIKAEYGELTNNMVNKFLPLINRFLRGLETSIGWLANPDAWAAEQADMQLYQASRKAINEYKEKYDKSTQLLMAGGSTSQSARQESLGWLLDEMRERRDDLMKAGNIEQMSTMNEVIRYFERLNQEVEDLVQPGKSIDQLKGELKQLKELWSASTNETVIGQLKREILELERELERLSNLGDPGAGGKGYKDFLGTVLTGSGLNEYFAEKYKKQHEGGIFKPQMGKHDLLGGVQRLEEYRESLEWLGETIAEYGDEI